MGFEGIGTPLLWVGFVVFVLAMLALDLVVFHRKAHEVSLKEALGWSVFWIGLAIAFNIGVYYWAGSESGLEFTAGYLIEKALSVDNIFVFMVIFNFFAVPPAYQHRVLFYGILGAIVMRALFIFAGAALLMHFHWVIYIFGGILVVTGARMLVRRDEEIHPERNPICRLVSKWVPMTKSYDAEKFFTVENGRRVATPLFLVLVTIEMTDLVFAVDSIPAVFAVTRDPFIVFTSNIFAILGLRALFFLLSGVMSRFHLLKVGLALVLLFVGAKMFIVEWVKIPVAISLTIVGSLIASSIVLSLLISPTRAEKYLAVVPAILGRMFNSAKSILLLAWLVGGTLWVTFSWDRQVAMPIFASLAIATIVAMATALANVRSSGSKTKTTVDPSESCG